MGQIYQRLRDSARGQPCTFQIPGVCNGDPTTTVLAHIRDETKGVGNKANCFSGGFACHSCHSHYDQHRMSREDELFYALRAMQRTIAAWVARGDLIIAGEKERKPRAPSKKSLPPKLSWKMS